MRILLVTDYYPPYIGGAQIQTHLIARELASLGNDVAVATVWQDDLPSREDDGGIAVHRLRQLRTLPGLARKQFQHHQPPFPDPVTTGALRRLVARWKPDLVHSYGWISYSAAAALLGTGVPLLITARDYGYSCAKRTLLRNDVGCEGPELLKCIACAGRHYGQPKGAIAALGVLGSRPLLRHRTNGIHSVSNYVRDIVRRDFLDADESTPAGSVIHDVIGSVPETYVDVSQDLEPLGLPDEPYLLFVGAFRRVKGLNELLAAYESLDRPPTLLLIGTMEPDSPTRFPDGVRILMNVAHPGVLAAAASKNCLFGVMPSLLPEPFGTVVCEVMSQGKPVIGTEPGGHSDMIEHGVSGLLVPRGDIEALAGAMQLLLADPVLRERLGAAARESARQFTIDAAIPRLVGLYEQLLAGADGAAPPTDPN